MNPRWRKFDPVAWFVLSVLAVVAIYGGVGTYYNSRADHKRDVAIDAVQSQRIADNNVAAAENNALLDCFDGFATDLAGGLPPVREATAERDDARAAWENASSAVSRAIEEALSRAVSGAPVDGSQVPVILGAFHDLDVASTELHKANQNLRQVRADNPYPPPPSEFCSA